MLQRKKHGKPFCKPLSYEGMLPLAPQIKNQKKTERVIDARICVLSGCRYLQTAHDRAGGQVIRSCGAQVFRAHLPAEELQKEIERNPSNIAGADQDNNPFLLRLLMAPECVRPECGVSEINYIERVLEIDAEEIESGLFS